ncbi:MAG: glycosyltransferase [Armatimonadota bacterium]|jgi:glycosyltransferase involved in cell wall biosynthesis
MASRIDQHDIRDIAAPAQGCVLVLTRGPVQTCGLLMRLARQLGQEGVLVIAVAGTLECDDTQERDGNVALIRLASPGPLRGNLRKAPRWIAARRHFDRVVHEIARRANPRAVLFENVEAAGLAIRLKALMPERALVYLASELSCTGIPWVYRRQERHAVEHLTGVIMNEPHRLAIWYANMGRRIPGIVIPNTVRLSEIPSNDGDGRQLRNSFPEHGEHINTLLLYHGLLEDARCLHEIVEAVAASPSDVGLAIIGAAGANGGYPLGDIGERIAAPDLRERVGVLPFQPRHRLLELVQHADVGMLLYRDVSLNYYFCAPNKLYEYAACGLPMIGPAWLGVSELFRRHGLGLTVIPDDMAQIAAAIEAMRDPEVRAGYAGSAARAFRDDLCFERCWEKEKATLLEWLQV